MRMGTVAVSEALGAEALAGLIAETGSSALATTPSQPSPMARLDNRQLAHLVAVANSPLPVLPACEPAEFIKLMRSLTVLPSRGDDERKGKLRLSIYHRLIGRHPREAIAFMVERVLTTLEWFPSPKQCLDILAGWSRRDDAVSDRDRAARHVRHEVRARFDALMLMLDRRELDQAAIDKLPLAIRDIAAERGFLRRHDDGVYRARPLPVVIDA